MGGDCEHRLEDGESRREEVGVDRWTGGMMNIWGGGGSASEAKSYRTTPLDPLPPTPHPQEGE
jgi:hypothetical protein